MGTKVIKGQVLKEIESNTTYMGCTFYLQKQFDVSNCHFDNCSFRSNLELWAKNSLEFSNCSFSNHFILGVDGESIHAVVKNIDQYRYLTALYGRYWLDYFPKEICTLSNIVHISWHKNELVKLPKEIGQLTKLSRLDLNLNSLTKIPKEIGDLQNLTYLNLYGYYLKKVPKEIWQLRNLKCLNLSGHSKLHKLPKGIEQLGNISHLYLPSSLKKIPKEISKLPKLEYLHICGAFKGKYPKIPEEILNMRGLFIEKKCMDYMDFERPSY